MSRIAPRVLSQKIVQNTISGGPPAAGCSKSGRGVESKQNVVGRGCDWATTTTMKEEKRVYLSVNFSTTQIMK